MQLPEISSFFREFKLFYKHPLLFPAALVVTLVPSLYSAIYLKSIWDPYGRFENLPVAVVNGDRGLVYHKNNITLGKEVLEKLQEKKAFLYQEYPDSQSAQNAVTLGDAYFALIIPADFSEKAIPGRSKDPGNFTIYVSEGKLYGLDSR